MKKINSILLIFVLSVTMFSCTDLEEKVFSSVTEQSYQYTEKDFDPFVASVYPPMRSFVNHFNYFATQEVSSDAIVMPPSASGWDVGGVHRRLHYHTWNTEQRQVREFWASLYRGALLCNSVINQIETEVLPASAEKKQEGLAELRAMRAYYYWLICDNYGDAPLVTTASFELPGITSRKEIYNFIVKELNEAIPLLSDVQGQAYYGRMNKWAAKCLLANIYLNAEVYIGEANWAGCMKECDDIISSGKYALSANYNESFRAIGVETSKEILFTIPYDKILAGGNIMHLYSWHAVLKDKFKMETAPWGSGSAMGVTQFINTYDDEDSRLVDSWLMGPQLKPDGTPILCSYTLRGEPLVYVKELPDASFTEENEGYRMNKFEIIPGTGNDSDTDYPIFRYAEVLLMKAECLLRLGQSGAGQLVTQVRERAFKSNPGKAAVTDAQLKANSSYEYGYFEDYKMVDKGNLDPVQFGRLYDELGWEFVWECHRRRDMIRFGIYTKKSWLSHKPQGDYRAVFPIPETVLTSNPNIIQNPNYQ